MPSQPRDLAHDLSQILRDLVTLIRRSTDPGLLSAPQISILSSLEHGPRRITALAGEHGVRTPTMTTHITRLQAAGTVHRGTDAADGRAVVVELTDHGRRLLATARQARIDHLTARLRHLTDDERSAIAAALPHLAKLTAAPDPESLPPAARTPRRDQEDQEN
ncbi:DNA-binding MarR family transcriptional regulator [Nocardiopsis mwathae]|uniref:DNA-binding MarR family transcriptional regulator n=1 Tax=Nocardiopsis mwathae TaxID=1472723 RepID=A0A7W9YGH6_9ACTN|nr:DNA-binding MarR family transcriptional regulator [Nocardiopsis mwathae]